MPSDPKFTDPPETKGPRTRGVLPAPDAEDVVASTAPDDDLADLFPSTLSAEPVAAQFTPGQTLLIHILEDGFTANGRVWYRGQELEYVVGEEPFNDTLDMHGRSWLALSPSDQMRRYGKAMFGIGPWPGGSYEHEQALKAERERNRTPPTITKLSPSVITRT